MVVKSTGRGPTSGLKHAVQIKRKKILLPFLLVGVFAKTFSSLKADLCSSVSGPRFQHEVPSESPDARS
jgi:hypothetical protein